MARLSIDTSNIAPFAIAPFATAQLRRVQSANTTSDQASEQIREVGNETIVGVVKDAPAVTLALEANLVNSRLLAIMANRDPASTWSNQPVQDLLGQVDMDFNLLQRNTSRDDWLRSTYIKQAALTSYRIAASVDGNATETFEFNADNKTGFERWIQVDRVTAGSNNQTAFTITETPVPLTRGKEAGNVLKSVFKAAPDGPSTYFLEGAGLDYTVAGTSVTFTATGAADIATGDVVVFTYQTDADPGAGDQFQAKDTISPAAIRGYYFVPVRLRVSGTTLPIRGAQNVEATMNFATNVEKGMGSQAVGSERVIPAEVTGNFTILEEGFDAERFLYTGSTSVSGTDYPIEAFLENIQLELDFLHPDTQALLRTDTLSGIAITGDNRDTVVEQAGAKVFNFSAATDFSWFNDKVV